MSELILYDRSRVTCDWQCPRKRYLNYEIFGQGIAPATTSLELYLGTAVHDGLAAIAHMQKDGVPTSFEEIEEVAKQQLMQALSPHNVGEVDELQFANEQTTLTAGLLRGFYQYMWPKIMQQYPEIVAIEQEMHYDHDGLRFMSRPDLVLRDKDGFIWYLEYKTTSSKKDGWINSWDTAVQLHSSIRAIESTLGEKVTGVIVQGLYKGYECLVPETPVLTADLKWVPVGSLKIGDKLVGFEEHAGNNRSGGKSLRQWQEAAVLAVGREKLPCYELSFEDGSTVVCSSKHLWLKAWKPVGMGSATWITTEDIKPKTRIIKLFDTWAGTGEMDPYDAGYLSAAFDGEGSLANMQFDSKGKEYYSLGLQFTQNPNQMLDHVKSILDKYNVKYSVHSRGGSRKIKDIQIYGKIKVLSLLGKIQPKRLIPKLNFNRLGMIKDLPSRPVRVISKKFLGEREVVTLGTSCETLVANGFASHNSYGKQNSPFCYSYFKAGTPPFNSPQYSYDYKPGYKKYPVWQMEGGLAEWIKNMPDTLLSEQFPTTVPIFVKDEMIDSFFSQRKFREHEINLANQMLAVSDETSAQGILDTAFPQKFEQCQPAYGRQCEFKRICFSHVPDPLASGFTKREPHHEEEKLKWQERNEQ